MKKRPFLQITSPSFGKQGFAALAFAFLGTACHNYTAAPVCDGSNAVEIPGMTGTYTVSAQDSETFATSTVEIEVKTEKAGTLTMAATGGKATASRTCQVGGIFVAESQDEVTGAYTQSRVAVTGLGVSIVPLFYDKAGLDAAGVKNEIFNVPEGQQEAWLSHVPSALVQSAKSAFALSQKVPALLVHNEGVPTAVVMRNAKSSPFNLTLIRK